MILQLTASSVWETLLRFQISRNSGLLRAQCACEQHGWTPWKAVQSPEVALAASRPERQPSSPGDWSLSSPPPMKAKSSKMMNRRERECCWCKGDRPPPVTCVIVPFLCFLSLVTLSKQLPPAHPVQQTAGPAGRASCVRAPSDRSLCPAGREQVREGEGSWKQVLACAWGPRGWNLGSGRLCHES